MTYEEGYSFPSPPTRGLGDQGERRLLSVVVRSFFSEVLITLFIKNKYINRTYSSRGRHAARAKQTLLESFYYV